MLSTVTTIIGWAAVIFMLAVTVLLAMNKQTGLKLIQHRPEMLPQALLVRYAGLTLLALLAVLINAPTILFAMLLSFAVIGLGDAFIYRRAGHPFWLHLFGGGAAFIGAIIAFFAIP
ncbi:hypothetical protein [Sedimentitalea arenosa]|jgi:hypothetical protein|uniref:Uncharacterized protein n=1 Tax=Sedimentitalea arenosa TaxID=2798803 RepID=A0A8J7J3X5_9RHOB|nr:hypothetical protein [Arenibacterium arenosum]MBJ6373255.1 hypothetical protein [Arenibacterium arenosum]